MAHPSSLHEACVARRFRIRGVVQGVGFRPFVHRIAVARGLTGSVGNDADGVFVVVEGDPARVDDFAQALRREAPAAARIEDVQTEPLVPAGLAGFTIEASVVAGRSAAQPLAVGPDLSTCPDCLRELFDPADRRHRYPFLNCTACGPRYTIVVDVPYDRERTAMAGFALCADCAREYADPADRRFHAEPTACPVCGPQPSFTDRDGVVLAERDAAVGAAVDSLRAGQVVAVLGLGGFHLMVRADDPAAVATLRQRKRRGDKPFAVLFADLEAVRAEVPVSPGEAELLQGPAAPIVLLARRGPCRRICEAVAPGAPDLGAMLANNPLQHLLCRGVGVPLVATSGNLRDEPLCITPAEGLLRLGSLADAFLVHDRPILRPIDDSIVQVVAGEVVVLRRARGYAPLAFDWDRLPEHGVDLATGPHTKNTVALRTGRRVVLSPHVGDLTTVAARDHHERALDDLQQLLGVQAERVVCDTHPDYASTLSAERRSAAPLRVPHHAAHAFALALEHRLTAPFLAVTWDGTGHGDDGTVWGGEFLRVDPLAGVAAREGRIAPFALPGGESAVAEPWRIAAGLCLGLEPELRDFAERRLFEAAGLAASDLRRVQAIAGVGPQTSSAGRLFDALGALVAGVGVATHEAAAARALTALAWRAEPGLDVPRATPAATGGLLDFDPCQPFAAAVRSLRCGDSAAVVARAFHDTLVAWILAMADRFRPLDIGLTGGCFQNRLLAESAVRALRDAGHRVWFAQRIPPNDGGVAAGQLVGAAFGVPVQEVSG